MMVMEPSRTSFFPPMMRVSFLDRISARPVVAMAVANTPSRT